jgi:hypothetical protein
MDIDFPAAHSMDAMWFAVDGQGQVAVFVTGENGHAPEQFPEGEIGPWYGLCELFVGRDDLAYHLPDEDLADRVGVFFYDYDNSFDPIAPYTRSVKPSVFLHLDQLPPRFRAEFLRCRFPQLDFAQAEHIQPLEYGRCGYWYKESRVAYLLSDGRTVKPIPGQEERFREFCEAFCRERPDAARELRFEGIDTDQERT